MRARWSGSREQVLGGSRGRLGCVGEEGRAGAGEALGLLGLRAVEREEHRRGAARRGLERGLAAGGDDDVGGSQRRAQGRRRFEHDGPGGRTQAGGRAPHHGRRASVERGRRRFRQLVALRSRAGGHEHAGAAGVGRLLPELPPQAGVLEAVEPAVAAGDRGDHERDARRHLATVVEERDRQPGGESRHVEAVAVDHRDVRSRARRASPPTASRPRRRARTALGASNARQRTGPAQRRRERRAAAHVAHPDRRRRVRDDGDHARSSSARCAG